MLRAIFTVRLLDDGNNRYQADGGWHRRGERGIAGVMIMVVMVMMVMIMVEGDDDDDKYLSIQPI